MGEFLAGLTVILLSLGLTTLIAAAIRAWVVAKAGLVPAILGAGAVISLLGVGMGASILGPLASDVSEFLFFLCAAQMLVPALFIWWVVQDDKKLELNRLVAADL